MTCKDVQNPIDTLPGARRSDTRLAAIERHSLGCADCRRAFDAETRLDHRLSGLPDPAPPSEMAVEIRARIARSVATGVLEPTPETTPAPRQPESAVEGWFSWGALLLGAVAAVAAGSLRWLDGEAALLLAPPALRAVLSGMVEARHDGAVALVLTAGLLLYLAGLFSMLRREGAGDPRVGV